MTEKAEKNKSSAGKFFLGAAIGAAVGAIASKFINLNPDEDEEEENTCPKCDKDGKKCECKKEEVAKEAVEKKPVKKTAEKK